MHMLLFCRTHVQHISLPWKGIWFKFGLIKDKFLWGGRVKVQEVVHTKDRVLFLLAACEMFICAWIPIIMLFFFIYTVYVYHLYTTGLGQLVTCHYSQTCLYWAAGILTVCSQLCFWKWKTNFFNKAQLTWITLWFLEKEINREFVIYRHSFSSLIYYLLGLCMDTCTVQLSTPGLICAMHIDLKHSLVLDK